MDGHSCVRGVTIREQRDRDAALLVEGRIRDLDIMNYSQQMMMLAVWFTRLFK